MRRTLTRRPRLMLAAACALLVLIPPSVGLATVVTYFSAGLCPPLSGGDTSGSAVRDYNRVYRPVGNLFKLYYGTGASWQDAWSNPFVSPNSPTSTTAGCRNQEISSVTSVTCQTTT